jgi:FkbM family methyltransferase
LSSLRKLAFVVASTEHGTMIVNRFDRHMTGPNTGHGAGYQLLETAAYDQDEVRILLSLLDLRREQYGDGIVAVDCGANFGVHTIECAKHMTRWGVIVAFEAQERIFYALAGNIALNNCFNARAIFAAVTNTRGTMKIPRPDYLADASFGSLELKKRANTEYIGQPIDYSEDKMTEIQAVTLDSFNFPRLDLIKLDVEGMELDALAGADQCIGRHRPFIVAEMIKTDKDALGAWLQARDYCVFPIGINILAIHKSDKCLPYVKFEQPKSAA